MYVIFVLIFSSIFVKNHPISNYFNFVLAISFGQLLSAIFPFGLIPKGGFVHWKFGPIEGDPNF
jgi:hypothetical protein